eukprot:1900270-Ditylum_brightwellii.AAC.1
MTHKVIREGDMKIPNGDGTYSRVHAWYNPTMPTAVLSQEKVFRDTKSYIRKTLYTVMKTLWQTDSP